MKLYTLWHYNYEQTSMWGPFSTPELAAAEWWRHRHNSPRLSESYWEEFGIEVHVLDQPDSPYETLDLKDFPDPTVVLADQTDN